MKCINVRKEKLQQVIGSKKIICFGASKTMQLCYAQYAEWFDEWSDRILFFVDSSKEKCGIKYHLGQKEYDIYPKSKLNDVAADDVVIMITSSLKYAFEIWDYLDNLENLDSCMCLSLILLLNIGPEQIDDSAVASKLSADVPVVNLKRIHTFWFSKEEIPPNYQRCIDSWKEKCPDYEIQIWNSDNYDVTKNEYMYEAYQEKKWAFVSDFARLDVVYHYGGVYLDMDVEMINKIDDLLKLPCFFGIDSNSYIDLGSGFGATQKHPFIKQLMDNYKYLRFRMENGEINQTTQPRVLLDTFLKQGYCRKRDSQLMKGVAYLSTNYINVDGGKDLGNRYHYSGKEYLVHWHNAGWWSEEERQQRDKVFCEPLREWEGKFEILY